MDFGLPRVARGSGRRRRGRELGGVLEGFWRVGCLASEDLVATACVNLDFEAARTEGNSLNE